MGTVPIHKSVPLEHAVSDYDDMRSYVVTTPGPFAVIPCICRQGQALTGHPCRQTSETRNCLKFGAAEGLTGLWTGDGSKPIPKE